MTTDPQHSPKNFAGVTVSSTFTDLKEHRVALIDAINGIHLHPVVMEHHAAKNMDVIDSSIQMVRDGAAYIGIISLKYGQVPPCPRRNPDDRSITELEFNEEVNKGTFYFTDKYNVSFSNVQPVSPEIRDIVRTTSGLGVTSFLCKLRFRKSRHPRSRSSGYAISRRTQCTIDVR